MNIRYIDPLSRAYGRMKRALFGPFSISKWFAVGFTAFLANLMDWKGGNGGGGGGRFGGVQDWEDIIYFPRHAREWLVDHPQWFMIVVFGIAMLLIIAVLLFWLSSRGKFMFLDNVVHDRAQVKKPWHEFRNEAWSLFLWRTGVGIVVLVIIGAYLVHCYSTIVAVYEREGDVLALIGPGIRMILGLIGLGVLAGFLSMLVTDFIVPIMYKHRCKVLVAWNRFLPLFAENILPFIGYGFFILGLKVLVALGVIVAGLVTCCIGFIFLMIPYIGSVILLPVAYTFRGLSVEFLEQFGPDYELFPRMMPATDGAGSHAP